MLSKKLFKTIIWIEFMMDKIAAFISIPKCATKTILNMFDLGFNRDNDGDDPINHYVIYENHQTMRVLNSKYDLTDIFTFTFVRHPFDRVKSWFLYHKYNEKIPMYQDLSLNEWITQCCKTHWKVQNGTNWEQLNESPLLQYNFIHGEKRIDFIGKMESFEKDCKEVIDILNKKFIENKISKTITFDHIKENSLCKNVSETLTEESKQIIFHLFKKDFDYFEYKY